MASAKAINMALQMLQELFPMWDQTDMTERVWMAALRDLTDAELQQAVDVFLLTFNSEFAPRQPAPGDIRKCVKKANELDYGWQEAWNEIMEKAHAIKYPPMVAGEFRKPRLSYPQTEQLMRQMGGPDFFLNLRLEDNNTAKAQFRNAWQSMTELVPLKPEQKQQPEGDVRYVEAPREPLPPELEAKARQIKPYLQGTSASPFSALSAASKTLAQRLLTSAPDSEPAEEPPTPHAERRESMAALARKVAAEYANLSPEAQFEVIKELMRKSDPGPGMDA